MTEFIDKIIHQIDLTSILYTIGILIFGFWLLRTSLGRRALTDSQPRRNNMPFFIPFVVLFIWVSVTSIGISIAKNISSDVINPQSVFLKNLVISFINLLTIIASLLIARAYFARRLKGFGLNIKTVFSDFFVGLVNLLTVSPLVFLTVFVTLQLGQLIYGSDFNITPHEELKKATEYIQTNIRIIILINGGLLVPILEEILFRGFLQTTIRSALKKPWASVCITSALFVAAHMDKSHWLALFVLSMCMGYAYEKSGSLLRAIVIHSLFNTLAIIATMSG